MLIPITVNVVDGQHRFAGFPATCAHIPTISIEHGVFKSLAAFATLTPYSFFVSTKVLALVLLILLRVCSTRISHALRVFNFRARLAGVLPVISAARILRVDDCEIVKWLGFPAFLAGSMAWLLIVWHVLHFIRTFQSFQQLTRLLPAYC